MDKKVTIKDIARLANVSIGTVDRVLHNRGEVAEASKKRILDIVEQTGYKPNLLARTLGANKKYVIAALLPNPKLDEYWGLTATGVEQSQEYYAQYGVTCKPYYFDLYNKQSFIDASHNLLSQKPDGILLAPVFYKEAKNFTAQCDKNRIPYILVNNNVAEAQPLSFIGQDLIQSGKVAAELLEMNQQAKGLYAILHIYDDIHDSIHLSEKEQGFKNYFSEKGEGYIIESLDLNTAHEPSIENELNAFLKKPDIRGLLVTTSRGASVVSKLLSKHGKKNIRLVAYDLLRENMRYLNNGIIDFLINQNSKRQGYLGMITLANHLLFQKKPSISTLFPLEIITRQNLKTYLEPEIFVLD